MSERANEDAVPFESMSCSAEPALPLVVSLGRPLLTALATPAVTPDEPPTPPPLLDATIEDPAALFSVIETNVIPRLMLLHRLPEPPVVPRAPHESRGALLEPEDHAQFLEIVRFAPEATVLRYVRGLLERGVPRPVLFVDLLGSAARELGELWRRDECSFADVTIGLCRLHMVIREESALFDLRRDGDRSQRRLLMTTAAGDQHILGAVLVAEFFRQDGWQVACEPGMSPDAIAGLLQAQPFDILGLSLSRETRAEDMRSEITSYRKASSNPRLGVMVGGQVFERDPELVEWVGADGVCRDARDAPGLARSVVEKRRLAPERAGNPPLA